MREIYQKLRRFQILIRKAVNTHMQGNFSSVFKGAGLEFDDVRSYQYGDDIRTIDWSASAKGHGVFVKTFREEREQTVFFMLDVSASQKIGAAGKRKEDIAKEVAGVLTLSAVSEQSHAGIYCFSDRKEKYVKPGKGMKTAYQIINTVYALQPASLKTNLNQSVFSVLNILKRRSVIILISDFIDQGYEQSLAAMGRLHDLVVIHVHDPREVDFPRVGIIPLFDRELNKTVWMNTSAPGFRKLITNSFSSNRSQIEEFCRKNQITYVSIDTLSDYVPPLVHMFNVRNKSRKSTTA